MKKYIFLSPLVAVMLFTGCGNTNSASSSDPTPHNTLKSVRTVNLETDWTWFVDMQRLQTEAGKQKFGFVASFYEGIPAEVTHLQYFLDTDNNASTGFSGTNGWQVRGADYLIEDGMLFQSQSDNEWKWKYLGKFDTYTKHKRDKGVAEITMQTQNTTIARIFNVQNTIPVSIEPYDQAWQGIYDTIYPIEIIPQTSQQDYIGIIKEALGEDFIAITQLQAAQFVVVTHMQNTHKTYTLYDISDPSKPIAKSIIAQEDGIFTLKYLHGIDDTKLEYTKITSDGRYKVLYDYQSAQVISETEVTAVNPDMIRTQLLKDQKITEQDSIKYLLSPDNTHLFIILNRQNDTAYVLYRIEGESIYFVRDLQNIADHPNNFQMVDNQTLTYTTISTRYKKRTTHLYNYPEDREIQSYITPKDNIAYQLRLNHTGYGRSLIESHLSPDMQHAVAYASFRSKKALYLYDTSNPEKIVKLATINYNTDETQYAFKAIRFIDDQTLSFILYTVTYSPEAQAYVPDGPAYAITYDIHTQKELSRVEQ